MATTIDAPTKACHNCRRQRLRCDRSYPHCNKCIAAGRECLGYGKLFRWTGAVASRGKLAGRTSSAPLDADAPASARSTAAGSASPPAAGSSSWPGSRARARGSLSPARLLSPSPSLSSSASSSASSSPSPSPLPPAAALPAATPTPQCPDADADPLVVGAGSDGDMPRYGDMQLTAANASVGSPWVLIDPLFQDLPPSHRYYLSYCTSLWPPSLPFPLGWTLCPTSPPALPCPARPLPHSLPSGSSHVVSYRHPRSWPPSVTQRLCKDLVSHDLPHRNPFRSLLPLTRANPLLQHIIVAASAAHLSNLVRASHRYSNSPDRLALTARADEASVRAHRDALVAKHRALNLMRYAIKDIDSTGGDVVLAAALFFINVELIESGKHGWKAHLEGAGKIMSLLQPVVAGNEALRDYMLSDCFM